MSIKKWGEYFVKLDKDILDDIFLQCKNETLEEMLQLPDTGTDDNLALVLERAMAYTDKVILELVSCLQEEI